MALRKETAPPHADMSHVDVRFRLLDRDRVLPYESLRAVVKSKKSEQMLEQITRV